MVKRYRGTDHTVFGNAFVEFQLKGAGDGIAASGE